MEVDVRGGERLAQLAKQCRKAGRKDLKLEMTRAIRKETTPVVLTARAAIRSTDMGVGSASSGHTGIRDRIARATRMKITTGTRAGVRIEVNESAMPPAEARMGKHVNKGAWRHRVYGHNVWVTQQSDAGWFSNTINASVPLLRERIGAVMDRIAAQIEKG